MIDVVSALMFTTSVRITLDCVLRIAVSGYAVREELAARHPAAAAALARPFHVDRRGGLRPGEAPTARFPVFGSDDRGLLLRYLRYWIEAGHAKIEQPLTPAQKQAMDVLDEVLR